MDIKFLASSLSLPTAITKTTVCSSWYLIKSGLVPFLPYPVHITTWFATPLCVTGIPPRSGAAKTAETPGITEGSTPISLKRRTSSPPLPKTNGSPIFSLTTCLPSASPPRHHEYISFCACSAQPGFLFATLTSPLTSARISGETNLSDITNASGSDIALTAATVKRSGSPGPAPTIVSLPGKGSESDVGEDVVDEGDCECNAEGLRHDDGGGGCE
mmetsp:Transcript_14328/g.29482  ORF Transcript_14328/g.29482 Transcript_14328/m.29482 type:complete len:216 (-) Transcript_14328:232-879(-)